MAITLFTDGRNAAANGVVDLLDNGTIVFYTSTDQEVATVTFGATAFGAAAVGVATANAIADDTNTTAGTIAKFAIKTSGGATIMTGTCTVTGAGGDITMPGLVFATGDTLSVSAFTYTQPA